MRRTLLFPLGCAAAAVLLAACAHDGRGLGSPNQHSQSIIRSTTTTAGTVASSDSVSVNLDDSLPGGTDEQLGMRMTLPFDSDTPIPSKYTCDGAGISLPVQWSDLPPGTVEVAIQVSDIEAENYVHWVIAGLDPKAGGIAEGKVPAGAIQAKNSAGTIGYTPPCPPKGTTHNYLVEVDALDQHITLANGVDAEKLIQAISDAESQAASDSGNVTR
jgi:hypothetical protein